MKEFLLNDAAVFNVRIEGTVGIRRECLRCDHHLAILQGKKSAVLADTNLKCNAKNKSVTSTLYMNI